MNMEILHSEQGTVCQGIEIKASLSKAILIVLAAGLLSACEVMSSANFPSVFGPSPVAPEPVVVDQTAKPEPAPSAEKSPSSDTKVVRGPATVENSGREDVQTKPATGVNAAPPAPAPPSKRDKSPPAELTLKDVALPPPPEPKVKSQKTAGQPQQKENEVASLPPPEPSPERPNERPELPVSPDRLMLKAKLSEKFKSAGCHGLFNDTERLIFTYASDASLPLDPNYISLIEAEIRLSIIQKNCGSVESSYPGFHFLNGLAAFYRGKFSQAAAAFAMALKSDKIYLKEKYYLIPETRQFKEIFSQCNDRKPLLREFREAKLIHVREGWEAALPLYSKILAQNPCKKLRLYAYRMTKE